MSDTIEQGAPLASGVRRYFPTPFVLAGLRHTPMRDLVRGRITGWLNWRGMIASAELPTPVRELIRRVVRRTRLWRLERSDVASELITHFVDGIAAGATADELIDAFGDERRAAKLIRRAKRRNRPYLWHAQKWAQRGALALFALYLAGVVRFYLGHPQISVDYMARLNEPVLRAAPQDRGWPLFRQALLSLRIGRCPVDPVVDALDDDQPWHDKRWPEGVAWLDRNQAGLDLLRQAAAKPTFGFVNGVEGTGDTYDPALGWKWTPQDTTSAAGWLLGVFSPYVNDLRTAGHLFNADFHAALAAHDIARAERDLDASLDLASQAHAPLLIVRLVTIGIEADALEALQRELLADPSRFDDATLTRLAHHVAHIGEGGQTASALLDFSGERMIYYDALQHIYTDDGEGDGRLAPSSIEFLSFYAGPGTTADRSQWRAALLASAAAMSKSRRDNLAEYDRLMDLSAAAMARPYRESGEALAREIGDTIRRDQASKVRAAHYLPLVILTPNLARAFATAEKLLAQRDATVAAVALELYRRQHGGAYPATLDALAPALLPAVPVDRATGDALRYRMIDGKPVLYSVGIDRIDDGGRVPIRFGGPDIDAVAIGTSGPPAKVLPETGGRGDWVLYGQPRIAADDEMEQRYRDVVAAHDTEARAATTQPSTQPLASCSCDD